MSKKCIRELLEELEEKTLSSTAAKSSRSRGRRVTENKCQIRTEFQRDRDRLVHSKAFRRLMHKTQVFLSPEGDHYRTRLTHAIEVSQIARTVARALMLNEDLTEAIALGHDLGHTPFGHIGEEAFTECLNDIKGSYPEVPLPFRHNEQSLRVVDFIEKKGAGLNLTDEVRDGILHHTGKKLPYTHEGQIVRIADRIAYVNHDIDDALRAQVIRKRDLPKKPQEILGFEHSERINNAVQNLIKESAKTGKIGMSEECWKALGSLRDFLFEAVYLNSEAKSEDIKAKEVLTLLFRFYFQNPEKLPKEFLPENNAEIPVRVCDYIAGMTDRFAIRKFEEIYVPQSWMV